MFECVWTHTFTNTFSYIHSCTCTLTYTHFPWTQITIFKLIDLLFLFFQENVLLPLYSKVIFKYFIIISWQLLELYCIRLLNVAPFQNFRVLFTKKKMPFFHKKVSWSISNASLNF